MPVLVLGFLGKGWHLSDWGSLYFCVGLAQKTRKGNKLSGHYPQGKKEKICGSNMSEPGRYSWILKLREPMMKIKEDYETLLHTKTVSSKNKMCGQKWRIKRWRKNVRSK